MRDHKALTDVTLSAPNRAQTLERGLDVLDALYLSTQGQGVSELAATLGVHRTVVTRLLNTLEFKGFVERLPDRRYVLGMRLLRLASGVRRDLSVVTGPVLERLATSLGYTALLTIQDGDEAVIVGVVDPPDATVHLSYRLGSRHALTLGAEAKSILAGQPPRPGEDRSITRARKRGYAVSANEIVMGTCGLAAPIARPGRPAVASIGVISTHQFQERAVSASVIAAAQDVAAQLP